MTLRWPNGSRHTIRNCHHQPQCRRVRRREIGMAGVWVAGWVPQNIKTIRHRKSRRSDVVKKR